MTNDDGSQRLIKTIQSTLIKLPPIESINQPDLSLTEFKEQVSLCQTIDIKIIKMNKIGMREPLSIKW